MAELLNTQEIMTCINDMIDKAQEFICIVSPYINLEGEQRVFLEDASSMGIPITVVYRLEDEWSSQKSLDFLKTLQSVEMYACSRLHAKIYANENIALLASRNLYTTQEGCNIETGVMFTKEEAIYNGLHQTVDRIKRIGKIIKKSDIQPTVSGKPKKGFCIKCGKTVPYSPYEMPLCNKCNDEFQRSYYRGGFPGLFCHRCGKRQDGICYGMPMDYDCWEKDQKSDNQRW